MAERQLMKRTRFLLLFFVPVAMALLCGTAFNFLIEYKLRLERALLDKEQRTHLQIALDASTISFQSLMVQRDLTFALSQAKEGLIGDAEIYKLHSQIVDRLANFEQRLGQLVIDEDADRTGIKLEVPSQAFAEFKQFVLMSTDMAAIDPSLANQYLAKASEPYSAFAMQLHKIDEVMTQHALTRHIEVGRELSAFGDRMRALGLLGTLGLIALWLLIANRLARRLDMLSASLVALAANDDQTLAPLFAQVNIMAAQQGSLLGDMAMAVMAFRQTREDRRTVQAALVAEREHLDALIQGMPDLVWLKDSEGKYQIFNQRFLQQAGKAAEALRGLTDADLFSPDEANLYRDGDKAAIEMGRFSLPPHWRQFADGHRELITAIKTPIYGPDGELWGVLGVGRDVTDLQLAQDALREQEQQFSMIVSQAPIGILLVDRQTLGFLSFNDAACDALGYTRAEFSELTVYDLQVKMTRAEVDARIEEIIHKGGMEFENQRRTKQGELRDFWISMRPLTLKGRECLTGIWIDITDRKRNERDLQRYRSDLEQLVAERTVRLEEATRDLSRQAVELESANGELRAIFDCATVGIVIIKDRKILRCNRKLDDLFGFPEGGMVNQYTRAWYGSDAEYESQGSDQVYKSISAGNVYHYSQELYRRDGSRFWARLTAARIDTIEVKDAVICIVEDVTEEHRVAAELKLAKDMAESANRAKSSFLANMSHEIRTPMNAIIGLAHLIRRDPLSDRQTHQLDKVAAAAMHLLAVINDILDFSKIEAGKMTLDPTDFQLERVVSNVFALIADKAEAKNLELIAEIANVPQVLHGDGVRLGQVLLNFASNAVKFTDSGSVQLRCSETRSEGGVHWLKFEVRDTGIGLTEEQQSRLFAAFQQADVSTTRVYGGTGLGLAISRRLADLMGGHVGVESRPGKGSTFWLEAPFGIGVNPAGAGEELLPPRTRVLVLDDMEEARETLADMLVALGARADKVASGAEALQQVASADADGDPYQMVFSDWQMPGLNGTETCERIRQLPLRMQPVCILVSGSSGCPREDQEHSTFSAFIAKPVLPAMLANTIARTSGLARTSTLVDTGRQAVPSFEPGHRLLLAEDNPMNQEVAIELLSDLGFAVDLAHDGAQAVSLAQQHAYELILMDIQMPVMDGLEATRRIRQIPLHQLTPVLAMTANAFAEDRATALSAGMNDHVPKPVDPAQLCHALAKWLPDAVAANTETPVEAMPAKSNDEALRQHLSQIPTLHLESGLRSVRGSALKLADMLYRFGREHADDVTTITTDLQLNDKTSAQRGAHSLKGVAGLLGLEQLQQLAQHTESAIKFDAEAADLRASLNRLETALSLACEATHSLAVFLPSDKVLPESELVVPADLQEKLQALRNLLASDDLDATDTYNGLRTVITALYPAQAQPLRRAIDEFDFVEARQLLDQIIKH